MSKRKHRKRLSRERAARPARRRASVVVATVVLAGGILAAVLFLRGERGRTGSPPASSAPEGTPPAPVAVAASSGFRALNGRWLRPDGGYILEIRNVEATGKLNAAYFNPQSIKVSKAEASHEGGAIKVFIELRDVGYPGSTYTLTYDPKRDQLEGIYFQAALRQSFDVIFVRMK